MSITMLVTTSDADTAAKSFKSSDISDSELVRQSGVASDLFVSYNPSVHFVTLRGGTFPLCRAFQLLVSNEGGLISRT
jgi:hypothetical protein